MRDIRESRFRGMENLEQRLLLSSSAAEPHFLVEGQAQVQESVQLAEQLDPVPFWFQSPQAGWATVTLDPDTGQGGSEADGWLASQWKVYLPANESVSVLIQLGFDSDLSQGSLPDGSSEIWLQAMLRSTAVSIQAEVPEDQGDRIRWGSSRGVLPIEAFDTHAPALHSSVTSSVAIEDLAFQAGVSFSLSVELDEKAGPEFSFGQVRGYHDGAPVQPSELFLLADDPFEQVARDTQTNEFVLDIPTIWEDEIDPIRIPVMNSGVGILTYQVNMDMSGAFRLVGDGSGTVAPGQTAYLELLPSQHIQYTHQARVNGFEGAVFANGGLTITTNDATTPELRVSIRGSLAEDPIEVPQALIRTPEERLINERWINSESDSDSFKIRPEASGYFKVKVVVPEKLTGDSRVAARKAMRAGEVGLMLNDNQFQGNITVNYRGKVKQLGYMPLSQSDDNLKSISPAVLSGLVGKRYRLVVQSAKSAQVEIPGYFNPMSASVGSSAGTFVFSKKFDNEAAGSVKSVEVKNPGTKTLVLRPSATEGAFELVRQKPIRIKPGQSKNVQIRFLGGAAGTHEGAVIVKTSDKVHRTLRLETRIEVEQSASQISRSGYSASDFGLHVDVIGGADFYFTYRNVVAADEEELMLVDNN